MYKFCSMTNVRDEKGTLLPDTKRLTKFGKMLRATSLDELTEVFNIIKKDMSVIGDSGIIETIRKNFDFTKVLDA